MCPTCGESAARRSQARSRLGVPTRRQRQRGRGVGTLLLSRESSSGLRAAPAVPPSRLVTGYDQISSVDGVCGQRPGPADPCLRGHVVEIWDDPVPTGGEATHGVAHKRRGAWVRTGMQQLSASSPAFCWRDETGGHPVRTTAACRARNDGRLLVRRYGRAMFSYAKCEVERRFCPGAYPSSCAPLNVSDVGDRRRRSEINRKAVPHG